MSLSFPVLSSTSKEAWDILKKEFQGASKVITVKLQNLRQDFETLSMKNNELVQEYSSRVTEIVSQMRSHGQDVTDQLVVAKVLRSLSPKFDHVVVAIEESKDLSVFSFDELMGSLQAHETRINKSLDSSEEKAFQVIQSKKQSGQGVQGFGRGTFQGRGHRRGRGHGRGRNGVQCHYCHKFGHIEANCWDKDNQAGYAEEKEEEDGILFMAWSADAKVVANVWLVDSGCSHHMTGDKSFFKDLDETKKKQIWLGDNKQIQVEGEGTVAVHTSQGKIKHIQNVLFAPSLAHNLLSVGQLLDSGFFVLFDDGMCVTKNKRIGHVLVNIRMTPNRVFPLETSNIEHALVVSQKNVAVSKLWHLRYGHLNMYGLRFLSENEMVVGLPKLELVDKVCEGFIYGKLHRRSFAVGKSWRASSCIELIHVDLCRPVHTESLGGSQYFLLFTDDYSHMSWVYFLKFKLETFENLKNSKLW
ncbi:hypothetical protein ACH5RR_039665 [Cinchona calisaya]|uniref:Retrovirus-related Pol polyprotein from transposon TNT 1-94 n=1 Tax=Cinchona calisaya TaxID=153742 RepID=A0ABD2Y2B1_9GENT